MSGALPSIGICCTNAANLSVTVKDEDGVVRFSSGYDGFVNRIDKEYQSKSGTDSSASKLSMDRAGRSRCILPLSTSNSAAGGRVL